MDSSEESILVENLIVGDHAASDPLFRYYQKKIINIICFRLPQKSDDPQEIVQKAFVAFWEQKNDLKAKNL